MQRCLEMFEGWRYWVSSSCDSDLVLSRAICSVPFWRRYCLEGVTAEGDISQSSVASFQTWHTTLAHQPRPSPQAEGAASSRGDRDSLSHDPIGRGWLRAGAALAAPQRRCSYVAMSAPLLVQLVVSGHARKSYQGAAGLVEAVAKADCYSHTGNGSDQALGEGTASANQLQPQQQPSAPDG